MLLRTARFTFGYVTLVGLEPAPFKCVLMSTLKVVRKDMRDWVLTDESDRWTVFGTLACTWIPLFVVTLASRVQLVSSRLVLIFVLPLACCIWSGQSALDMVDPHMLGWVRPGLPVLSNLAGPVLHFKSAILNAWRDKVAADLCALEGFRRGPLLDIAGILQLLTFLLFWRDQALLRSVLGGCEDTLFRANSVCPDGDGHHFLGMHLPPLVEISKILIHDLIRMGRGHWPRCLLWHGWLPMLSGVNGASPWAADALLSGNTGCCGGLDIFVPN